MKNYITYVIILLAILPASCNRTTHVVTNTSVFASSNEMLLYNFRMLDTAIRDYKHRHNGNAPRDLAELVRGQCIDKMPINPLTRLPMSNVSLYSGYKRGNYTYLTYPMRYRTTANGAYLCTEEYLLIAYHDGNYPPRCEGQFGNALLNSVSRDVLYASGEILASTRSGIDNICPELEEVLDYNGYFSNNVHYANGDASQR
jgi:hypothetical protein